MPAVLVCMLRMRCYKQDLLAQAGHAGCGSAACVFPVKRPSAHNNIRCDRAAAIATVPTASTDNCAGVAGGERVLTLIGLCLFGLSVQYVPCDMYHQESGPTHVGPVWQCRNLGVPPWVLGIFLCVFTDTWL